MSRIRFRGLRETVNDPFRTFELTDQSWVSRRNLANPLTINLVVIGFLFLAAFAYRAAGVLLISWLLLNAYWFFTLKTIAQSLFVERKIQHRVFTEGRLVRFHYDIVNGSVFDLIHIMIVDHLGFADQTAIAVSAPEGVKAKSRLRINLEKLCDGGMGRKQLGPILIKVRDPFGLFEFEVALDEVDEIEVFPKVQVVGSLNELGTPTAPDFGIREVASRGTNVNFSGVRPYVHGDPIKSIAWKLSAKRQEMVVKEFEKAVNTEIWLALNLDPPLHIGRQALSSWEICKDLTLALASQMLEKGNRVGLISQEGRVEPGLGEAQFVQLSRFLFDQEPQPGSHPLDIVQSYCRAGVELIYITPFHTNDARNSMEVLRGLRSLGLQISVFWLETTQLSQAFRSSLEDVGHWLSTYPGEPGSWVDAYKLMGIQTYLLPHPEFKSVTQILKQVPK